MLEYSAVTLVLAVSALGVASVPVESNGPLLKVLWDGINAFYDSVYYVLQCSVP